MVHFRKKSSHSNGDNEKLDVKLSKEDADRLKVRTASVADPILEAVQEAQPFEQMAGTFEENANRHSYYTNENEVLQDIFGQPINQPDISNPTRARDERPLDTIRSFEYAISGDPSWAQQLETQQYGFRVRPDFPNFGGVNPYDGGNSQMYGEQAVYQPKTSTADVGEKKKKKKFGLFGKKKK
ncbi:hypothetical protein Kpol_1028p74 [Vanderwaltozyma polyspora DSM 70294]|uniref:Uncharacterized protein n=1 Tax=Vanderwaltozyma polyspora (strain ATCC 22028 / DSM 70294 / BCRC 21397 / CBS 2163 / NBRC 10782 / NRRL Y-8283 / UCD 57-17) TaxID=436907 RepID=A7TG41_VANPO|nr:uncharacterized protein Kpol_1028p74 [Vanderwaltozyma polyspora DSM 70294]EDO18798.1 hypothetical protein Kpol_1028p74 [Vanderwaltozyma polyspora DSM 70294]